MRVHVEENEKEWKVQNLDGEGLLRRLILPKSLLSSLGIALLASFLSFLFKFSSSFYNFRVRGMKFESFRACSVQIDELVPRRYGFVATSQQFLGISANSVCCSTAALPCHFARTDFQNDVSLSLFVRIAHMIRRWKALSLIFTLICNILHKSFRNLHRKVPQWITYIFLNSKCFEFSRFHSISSHLLQWTYMSNKSPIKTKTILFWYNLGLNACLKICKTMIHHLHAIVNPILLSEMLFFSFSWLHICYDFNHQKIDHNHLRKSIF